MRSNISFYTSSEVAFFIFSVTLPWIVPTPHPRHRIIWEVVYVNPCELTASVTAVANALACKYSNDELTLLASVLVQLGDTLVTIATQRAICENTNKTK